MCRRKSLPLIALLLGLILSGCGSANNISPESPYIGRWETTQAEMNGYSVKINEVLDEMSLTLEANGKAVYNSGEISKDEILTKEGTWEEAENSVIVHFGEESYTLQPKENGLSVIYQDITFQLEPINEDESEQ